MSDNPHPRLSLGIVIPTYWEAHNILHSIVFRKVRAHSGAPPHFESEIFGRRVLLCVSGVGRKAAAQAADELVAQGAKELISMGFCGALVPELKVGDLVTDRIITVDMPAKTPAERRALTERANAVAVDMETQAVIESGTRRGVPIRILRVVSDELNDDLTPLFGKRRTFSVFDIALRLTNPRVWPLAWKLKKHSYIARARLAKELIAFAKRDS